MKKQTLTLVPAGGLGNRILAISSALAFCKEKHRQLEIIWVKDANLNCDYDKLFYLESSSGVQIRNAKGFDFLVRDKPKKRNLYLSRLFQKHMYNKCIYYYNNDFQAQKNTHPAYDVRLDSFNRIYLLACWKYWETPEMFQYIKPCPDIEEKVKAITATFPENTIGVHIRRTDNTHTIQYSPTEMFLEAIESEIKNDSEVKFYLASDSLDEKKNLLNLHGDRIITSMKASERNTETGIIDAFVEMTVLSCTKKIYAGDSSFAQIASKFSGTNMIRLGLKWEN
jgi:hypothetical protein